MELIKTMYGDFNYDLKDIIKFNKGIPAFEEYKEYLLLKLDIEGFELLQSIDNMEVGFVVTSPFDIEDNYEIKLTEEIINNLQIQEPNEVKLVSLVTINSSVENMTVNLKAPVVINTNTKLGEQLITDKTKYKIKHPLIKR